MNFWFKFKSEFFADLQIKMLLKSNEGERLFVIYMRLLCAAVGSEGVVEYQGIASDLCEELSIVLDEPIELVKTSIATLERLHLAEVMQDGSLYLPQLPALTGSSKSGAERVREHRERKKQGVTLCNSDVTACNGDETSDSVTECYDETPVTEKRRVREEKDLEPKSKKITDHNPNSGSSPRAFGGAGGGGTLTLDDLADPSELHNDDGELPF